MIALATDLLTDTQVGKAMPFSIFLPLNILPTALHPHKCSSCTSLHALLPHLQQRSPRLVGLALQHPGTNDPFQAVGQRPHSSMKASPF